MYNNYPATGTQYVCTVGAVDIRRGVCKCISDTGENLTDVRWVVPMGGNDGTGTSHHPIEGSRVLVDVASGFPFIVGAILTDLVKDIKRQNIGRQDANEADIADYTTIKVGDLSRGPGTPDDQRPGDIISTTDGGAVQGILRSGSVINKAAPLAQMIMSRFGDLVRLVSRNFEHFTDVDQTVKASVRGKVYEAQEVYRSPTKSRAEQPSFTRYSGDVSWGETLGKAYASFTSDTFPTAPTIPEDSSLINKEYTFNDEGITTSVWTQNIDGTQTLALTDKLLINKNADGSYHMTAAGGALTLDIASDTGNVTLTTTGMLDVSAADTTFNLANTTFNLDTTSFNTTGTTTFTCDGNFSVTAPVIMLN